MRTEEDEIIEKARESFDTDWLWHVYAQALGVTAGSKIKDVVKQRLQALYAVERAAKRLRG